MSDDDQERPPDGRSSQQDRTSSSAESPPTRPDADMRVRKVIWWIANVPAVVAVGLLLADPTRPLLPVLALLGVAAALWLGPVFWPRQAHRTPQDKHNRTKQPGTRPRTA